MSCPCSVYTCPLCFVVYIIFSIKCESSVAVWSSLLRVSCWAKILQSAPGAIAEIVLNLGFTLAAIVLFISLSAVLVFNVTYLFNVKKISNILRTLFHSSCFVMSTLSMPFMNSITYQILKFAKLVVIFFALLSCLSFEHLCAHKWYNQCGGILHRCIYAWTW